MFKKKGFTLVELLIVIGVIAVLAVIAFVFLNPMARFEDSRNAKRSTDVNNLVSSIKLQQVDYKGEFNGTIQNLLPGVYYQIGSASPGCDVTCLNPDISLEEDCIDLQFLVEEKYIAEIPIDPIASYASSEMTGYYVTKTSTDQIIVGACNEEMGSGSVIPSIEAFR